MSASDAIRKIHSGSRVFPGSGCAEPRYLLFELVIAQVNPRMPHSLGDCFIHISEIDCIVEHEEELLEVPPSPPDDVSRAVARHISRLVENGSTISDGCVLHTIYDSGMLLWISASMKYLLNRIL